MWEDFMKEITPSSEAFLRNMVLLSQGTSLFVEPESLVSIRAPSRLYIEPDEQTHTPTSFP
jgi:hypothetical protein